MRLDTKRPHQVSPRSLFAEFFGSATDLVLKPARTFDLLLKRPGERIREYLQGNREEIAGPGRMAFLCVSLFLIVNNALATSSSALFDPLVWWRDFWPYLAPLLLLPVSALQRRLFRKYDLTFGDTFTFGLYMLGQVAIFRTALLVLDAVTGFGDVHTSTAGLVRTGAIMLAEAAYIAWTATGLYRDRRPSVWLRGALSYGAFAALGYGLVSAVVYYVLRGLFS